MSLVGSLEDLGLGDILQIISLSRKSGVLLLRSEHGEGQILFDQGLIRGAFVKGGPTALRELLAQRGAVEAESLENAWQEARGRGAPLAEVLAERGLLAADALDELRRDNIERGVLRMFEWPTGEFSFEVREVDGDGGEELSVAPGINPQFLALEGTRRADEGSEADEAAGVGEDGDDAPEPVFAGEDAAEQEPQEAPLVAEAVEAPEATLAFSGEGDGEGVVEADFAGDASAEALPAAEVAPDEEEPGAAIALQDADGDDEGVAPAALLDEPEDGDTPQGGAEPTREAPTPARARSEAAAGAAAPDAPGPMPPVVVIDPDLAMLEWLKGALGALCGQVHIFQRTDLGVERIRQYLARARTPAVLLAADAPADPVSGGRDPFEMVARLKRQSTRMPVLLLVPHGEEPPRPPRGGARPDGVVTKPAATHLADERCVREREAAADRVREGLRACARGRGPRTRRGPAAAGDAVARLKETSARIRAGSSRGDVLPQVLAFAAQSFRRVALFMVREGEALGLAQAGLAAAGGPGDEALRRVRLPCREAGWLRAVLESRQPLRSGPLDAGDRRLAGLLGGRVPQEAYVAPLESGGQVVALLYADNLPEGEPLGDSSPLEVVLHEAGMALDRAVLERALEQADS